MPMAGTTMSTRTVAPMIPVNRTIQAQTAILPGRIRACHSEVGSVCFGPAALNGSHECRSAEAEKDEMHSHGGAPGGMGGMGGMDMEGAETLVTIRRSDVSRSRNP